MKHVLIFLLLIVSSTSFSQTKALAPVPPSKISWKEPVRKSGQQFGSTALFEGSAHDFEYMAMDACALFTSGKQIRMQVPKNEEHLIMVKSGLVTVSFNDSTWTLGPGSVIVLLPSQRFSIRAAEPGDARFYRMKYRSRTPMDEARGKASGGSFVRDWNKLAFREHSRGGVRSYFEKATAMSRRLEMHVTTLKPGLKSHDPHTHRAEEIILMLEDTSEGHSQTEMLVGENLFQGGAGDMYYVGSNLLHGIKNIGTVTCSYFAFQFE